MGFDNECILNIQSLAGEYFCPVCRLLVYPNEALQSQCTHLYCKPCLTYVVSTTRACPYDGYLVTEADSKPLVESNKALAETIGKITVHCLYHRSGCTWQGQLTDCTSHCATCPYGNSPVVCNRCGTQIVHRQVQEHAQNCPGVQPQAHQESVAPAAAVPTEQNQTTSQLATQASQAQPSQVAAAQPSGQDQTQVNVNAQPQNATQAVPTAEQWYQQQQQQYQQYYQQYPGYDPSQQYYQSYDPYQQQAYQQYQQQLQAHPPHSVQAQHQPQVYMQPQPQVQLQVQPQQHPQPQVQPQQHPQPQVQHQQQPQSQVQSQQQLQPQVQHQQQPQSQVQSQQQPQSQSQVQPQIQTQPQIQVQPQVQNLPQTQPQAHVLAAGQPQVQAQIIPQSVSQTHSQMQQQQPIPPSQGPQHPQLYAQVQPPIPLQPQQVPVQSHPQQRPHLPPHQQPPPQMQHPPPHQLPRPNLGPQPQLSVQPQLQQQTNVQMQPQPQAQPLPQSHPRPQSQPSSVHAAAGSHTYPHLHPQHQMPPAAPQPQSMPMHLQSQAMPQQALQQSGQAPPFPPQQLPQMRPPLSHVPMQQPVMQAVHGQQSTMPPAQQPVHSHTQTPSLPPHQHPGVHPPSKQLVQVPTQQPQSFPGQTSSLVHGLPHQPPFVQQHPTMQLPLRPQGPSPSLQQQAPGRAHLQQNVPVSLGLLPHQSQTLPGRPMIPNQGLQHQRFHRPPSGTVPSNVKPLQSGALQPYPPRANARPPLFSESLPNPLRPQYGSENASFQSTKIQVSSSEHATLTNELKPNVSSQKVEKEGNSLSSQGADSVELKSFMSGSELKSGDTDEKIYNADESNNSASDVKEVTGSSQMLEKDHARNEEDLEEAKTKLVEDGSSMTVETVAAGIVVDPEIEDGKSVPFRLRQTESSQLEDKEIHEDTSQTNGPLQKPEVLKSADKDGEVHNLGLMDSSVSDRDGKRVISPGGKSGDKVNNKQAVSLKGDPLQGKMSGQPHGNMVRSQLPLQRPSVPDQILRPSMPHAQKMQVPGLVQSHLRPLGHMPGNVPVRGQPPLAPDHFRPPTAKQSPGPFLPDVPAGGYIGPGSSSLLRRGPPPFGSAIPRGHLNQDLPSSYATGPRIHGDQMMGPPLAGSALGAFESQGGLIPRGPLHVSEGHVRHPVPANATESEILRNQRPGFFNGRQHDPHFPGSAEHVPFGQTSDIPPNALIINGGPGKRLASGLQGSSIPFGLREERLQHDDRFKRLPEEGLNMLPGDRLKAFPVEPGRHMIDRREFTEDLRQFPRSAHLDSEVVPQFESYFKRPLDSSENPPRLLPPYQTGSLRPLDNPDFQRSASESGRHQIDGLPPIRNSGRDHPVPTRRWLEDGNGRDSRFFGGLPHMRSTEPFGPRNLPGHLHMSELAGVGGFHNRARVGDAGGLVNLPSRGVESGFSNSLPTHGYQKDGFFDAGDLESFERPRKRKTGSTGWCRICKLNCETMEGLEMHSQTREHQKKALDMVLSIKKDNSKKPKLSSDDHKSHEDGSKSKNASLENHGN